MIAVCKARYIRKTLMNIELLFLNACFSSNFWGLTQAYKLQPEDKVIYIYPHTQEQALDKGVSLKYHLFLIVFSIMGITILIRIPLACMYTATSIIFSIGY